MDTRGPALSCSTPRLDMKIMLAKLLREDLRTNILPCSRPGGPHLHTLLRNCKSLGSNELGHCRATVRLTRSRGTTVLFGPPDVYGLVGLVQVLQRYYFEALCSGWAPPTQAYPFAPRGPPDWLAVVEPFAPVTWQAVPLALRHRTRPEACCLLPTLRPC